MKRDKDLSMVRIRAFGKFAFPITDVALFMREIFGTKGIVMTYDIVEYLSLMVTEAFSSAVGESTSSVLDLSSDYRSLSQNVAEALNAQAVTIGITFSKVLVENVSLPDEVERLIDEQSGIGMWAKKDPPGIRAVQTGGMEHGRIIEAAEHRQGCGSAADSGGN